MIISDIDLAAVICTSTKQRPELSDNPDSRGLRTFTFQDSAEVINALAKFAAGELCLPAARLLSCRAHLYRQIRGKK